MLKKFLKKCQFSISLRLSQVQLRNNAAHISHIGVSFLWFTELFLIPGELVEGAEAEGGGGEGEPPL